MDRDFRRFEFFGAMSDFYGKKIDLVAYKVMLDEMVRDLGDPTDPLQRMLAEQLVIAHHVCGRLQARAAMHENCNNMDIFLRGAVRMMTEFRKHATIFSELRSKMPSQRSANAERNLESPNPGAAVDAEPKRFADGELVSKPGSGTVSNAA